MLGRGSIVSAGYRCQRARRSAPGVVGRESVGARRLSFDLLPTVLREYAGRGFSRGGLPKVGQHGGSRNFTPEQSKVIDDALASDDYEALSDKRQPRNSKRNRCKISYEGIRLRRKKGQP